MTEGIHPSQSGLVFSMAPFSCTELSQATDGLGSGSIRHRIVAANGFHS